MKNQFKAFFWTAAILLSFAGFIYAALLFPLVAFFIITAPAFFYISYSIYEIILKELEKKSYESDKIL